MPEFEPKYEPSGDRGSWYSKSEQQRREKLVADIKGFAYQVIEVFTNNAAEGQDVDKLREINAYFREAKERNTVVGVLRELELALIIFKVKPEAEEHAGQTRKRLGNVVRACSAAWGNKEVIEAALRS